MSLTGDGSGMDRNGALEPQTDSITFMSLRVWVLENRQMQSGGIQSRKLGPGLGFMGQISIDWQVVSKLFSCLSPIDGSNAAQQHTRFLCSARPYRRREKQIEMELGIRMIEMKLYLAIGIKMMLLTFHSLGLDSHKWACSHRSSGAAALQLH